MNKYYCINLLLLVGVCVGLWSCKDDVLIDYIRPNFHHSASISAVDTEQQLLSDLSGFTVDATTSFDHESHVTSVLTSVDGSFDLFLPRGIYDLTISKEGFGPITIHNFSIDSNTEVRFIDPLEMLFQKFHVRSHTTTIQYNPQGIPTLVLNTTPFHWRLGRYGAYVKVYAYDLDPTFGEPNVTLKQIIRPFSPANSDTITCNASLLVKYLQKNGFRGRKVYLRASIVNGPGYYDPAVDEMVNNTDGPLSDVISILIP